MGLRFPKGKDPDVARKKFKVGDMVTLTYFDHYSFRRASRDSAGDESPVYLKTTGEVISVGKRYLTLISCEVEGISKSECDGNDVLLNCIDKVKLWGKVKRDN